MSRHRRQHSQVLPPEILTGDEDLGNTNNANTTFLCGGHHWYTSGAILTVQESRETISNNREPVASGYSRLDAGLRSSYSQLGSSSYSSSSVALQPYNGYESILS
ncbi:hypothetical protein Lalb_Chr10g0106261 [Lupinus albus]|uniref:Uncharacterized protein n=1 Tax=Lupinus albus TaxID=3870 RepID=A0A6A4PXW7_LUPAL|nr:hypothetical protein Lalb_Chr10g0106261 [Lupinus albus]